MIDLGGSCSDGNETSISSTHAQRFSNDEDSGVAESSDEHQQHRKKEKTISISKLVRETGLTEHVHDITGLRFFSRFLYFDNIVDYHRIRNFH